MSWTKVGDRAYEDPRLEDAGKDAFVVHHLGLVVANRRGTDGSVTERQVRKECPYEELDVPTAIAALVRVGMWAEEGDGYRIVDFLNGDSDWCQMSADDQSYQRERKRRNNVNYRERIRGDAETRWAEEDEAKANGESRSRDRSRGRSRDRSVTVSSPAQPRPARSVSERARAGAPGSADAAPGARPRGTDKNTDANEATKQTFSLAYRARR